MFDSLMNSTAYLGNTTENFFKVSNLKIGHNYSFTVRARCLYSGQMCGEPATLLYDELGTGKTLTSSPLPQLTLIKASEADPRRSYYNIIQPITWWLSVLAGQDGRNHPAIFRCEYCGNLAMFGWVWSINTPSGHCTSNMGRNVALVANSAFHPPCSVGEDSSASKTDKSTDVAAIVVPILFVLLVTLGIGFIVLYTRHRRLQSSFTAFANSHYSSRLGSAIFSSGDDLGTWNLGILVGSDLVWKIPL